MSEEELSLDDLIEQRDHYSYSQINTFIRCPYQYLFRYILGYKMPPPSALVFGSTTHEALEANYKQKIESHVDLPVKKVQDVWACQWDLNLKKGIEFEDDENKNTMLDEGVKLITSYQELVAPTIQPVVVEEAFTLILEGVSKPVIGKIDLITDKDIIIDHKSSKRTPPQETVSKDFQLTVYSKAFYEKYRTLPKGLIMSYLVRTKKVSYPQISTERTMEDIKSLEHIISQVVRSIENGIFYPNPHNYLCSEKACGYWGHCKAGKVKVNW